MQPGKFPASSGVGISKSNFIPGATFSGVLEKGRYEVTSELDPNSPTQNIAGQFSVKLVDSNGNTLWTNTYTAPGAFFFVVNTGAPYPTATITNTGAAMLGRVSVIRLYPDRS